MDSMPDQRRRHRLGDRESPLRGVRAIPGLIPFGHDPPLFDDQQRAAAAAETAEAGYAPDFWGVHSPDERRYYTYLCLYYGGAPDERAA